MESFFSIPKPTTVCHNVNKIPLNPRKETMKKQVSSFYKFQYNVSCTNIIVMGNFYHICWLYYLPL